jgi:hypothetical protein
VVRRKEQEVNAEQVRAYVAAKWPAAMQSPVAKAIAAATAPEQNAEALAHARDSINVCEALGLDYDAETLSHNIETNFPELSLDDCDAIAEQAIGEAS